MYHERQSRQMCLVHALNALFQKPQFTSHSLDEICYALNGNRWFNPHRSFFGLGNYDVNVLMSALDKYDFKVSKGLVRMPVERIRFENLHAVIVNVPTKSYLPLWRGRHWYTILRQGDGKFVNLDSKLSQPEEIPDIPEHCRSLLNKSHEGNQLFLVGKCDPSLFLLPE
uniref:ubiquitinyl hydrolase 1 n=1 Tax=Angiostrongylus cantonensis TaxID=6313 RepID=A0A0K0D6V3_ANGCA